MDEKDVFRCQWWLSTPCPILTSTPNQISYNSFECHAFSGVCTIDRRQDMTVRVHIFIGQAAEPNIYIGSAVESDEPLHIKQMWTRITISVWQQLSVSGVVGPDSLRVVSRSKQWVEDYERTHHPMSRVRHLLLCMMKTVDHSSSVPVDIGFLSMDMKSLQEEIKVLGEIYATPKKTAHRRLVICLTDSYKNQKNKISHLLHNNNLLVSMTDEFHIWIRKGDTLYNVFANNRKERERRDWDKWIDHVLDLPTDFWYKVIPPEEKSTILVFEATDSSESDTWSEIFRAFRVSIDRVVYAQRKSSSQRFNPDIDMTNRKTDDSTFTTLVADCLGWTCYSPTEHVKPPKLTVE